MPLTNAAAGFIGASVTLVLVIIFMILMVILVRQCLAFLAKRNTIRAQAEQQRQQREQIRRRRGSITEPVPATFDWHHSIRIAGTPPPTYHEAKKLPSFDDAIVAHEKEKVISENGTTTTTLVESVDGSNSSNGSVGLSSSNNEEGAPNQSNSEHISIEVPVAFEVGGVTSPNHTSTTESHDHQMVTAHNQSQHTTSSPDHVEMRLVDETRTTFSTGYTEFGATTPM